MIEHLEVHAGTPRSVTSEIRYQAPNRLQTLVTQRLPPPTIKLTQVQIGSRQCQTPPGVCFKTPQAADPAHAVRALLGPALPVTYHTTTNQAGHLIILLTKQTSKNSHYLAELEIDAKTGLPLTFTSSVEQNGTKIITQTATFTYAPLSISLPPAAARR